MHARQSGTRHLPGLHGAAGEIIQGRNMDLACATELDAREAVLGRMKHQGEQLSLTRRIDSIRRSLRPRPAYTRAPDWPSPDVELAIASGLLLAESGHPLRYWLASLSDCRSYSSAFMAVQLRSVRTL